jgi:hypothetical protein
MSSSNLADACWNCNFAEAKQFLDCGADVDNPGGGNPLVYAAYQGQLAIVQLLLDHGADTTIRENGGSGKSAEDHAREKGYTGIAELIHDAAGRKRGPKENWVKMGDTTVAFVGTYPELKRRLTHIFNFETRERLIITENQKTKVETSPPPTSFDDLPPSAVEKAYDEFTRFGGVADRDFALHGTESIAKPKHGLDLK